MDWITGIQRAIDYIEAHLNDELDYNVIAREGFSSAFHFQRVFSILCGYTLGEYIRYRRLSVAGSKLASGSDRVIDIALEFGYDSPDSFAKAFRAFHGITPSQARGNGALLRSFSRLNIKVTLERGKDMQYKLEEKPTKLLTGFKRRFSGGSQRQKGSGPLLCMRNTGRAVRSGGKEPDSRYGLYCHDKLRRQRIRLLLCLSAAQMGIGGF